jgi:hypothetical protein
MGPAYKTQSSNSFTFPHELMIGTFALLLKHCSEFTHFISTMNMLHEENTFAFHYIYRGSETSALLGSVPLVCHTLLVCLYDSAFSWYDHESVSKSFRTGRMERELQMVQLSATRCSRIAILWVSLVSFAAIILCVASHRVFVVYFFIDSVRKLLDTPSYISLIWSFDLYIPLLLCYSPCMF